MVKSELMRESKEKKRNIWTIDVYNKTKEEGGYVYKEAMTIYYSEEEALRDAKNLAKSLKDESDVYSVSVYAGEYELENGDIYGESYAIETYMSKEGSKKMANKYRFLNHVVDSGQLKSKGNSDLRNVGDDVGSAAINISGGDSNSVLDISFELYFDSKEIIKNFMDYDEVLSKKIADDFDSTYDSGGWKEWRENWVEKQGWKLGMFKSDNTYNWGVFDGSVFEYTNFETDGRNGVIIMWHEGGDVRGNYSMPEIWYGDFESFIALQEIHDIQDEMAYRLGYDGSWDNLEKDINNWWFETGEESTTIQQDYENAGQMRLPIESGKKVAKSNEDVIRMFLENSFPKDKMLEWGTANLKISKRTDGWSLVNYSTPLLYRANDNPDVVYFNTIKYSVSTSKIQTQIKRIAEELGVKLEEVDEGGIMGKGAGVSNVKKADEEEMDPIKRLEEDYSLDIETATLVKEFLDDAGFEVDDVTNIEENSGGWDGMIQVDIGKNEEYYLFKDEDTARQIAIDMEKQTLESEGPQTMLGDNWKQWLDEKQLRSDLYDMVSENISDGTYDSELEEVWDASEDKSEIERKINDIQSNIDAEEDEDRKSELEEELDNLNSKLDDTKETFLDDLKQDPDNWDKFEDKVENYLNEMMDNLVDYVGEKNLVRYFDFDQAAEDVVDSDGAGSILSSYDGAEHNLPSGGVYYRYN